MFIIDEGVSCPLGFQCVNGCGNERSESGVEENWNEIFIGGERKDIS